MRTAARLSWVLALAAAWPAALQAQHVPYAASAATEARPLGPVQRLERRFLQISAGNLRLQAEASRLVLARSNNPAVKELAGALMARQEAVQPELLRLLQARGMALPVPPPGHARLLQQMAKLQGAKFDRLYVEAVVLRTSQADLANHEKLALQAQDPVLKAWAERQLPLLRQHLALAGRALPNAALRGQRAV